MSGGTHWAHGLLYRLGNYTLLWANTIQSEGNAYWYGNFYDIPQTMPGWMLGGYTLRCSM